MKSKLRWLFLLVPLALFIWAYQAASWRPKLVGVGPDVAAPVIEAQLQISPDAKRLVATTVTRGPQGGRAGLSLWSVDARKMLWKAKRSNRNSDLIPAAFSPDSKLLVVVWDRDDPSQSFDNFHAEILETASGKLRHRISVTMPTEFHSVAFASNRELILTTDEGVIIVDVQTGKQVRQWKFKLVASPITGRLALPNQSQVSADGMTVMALANGETETLVALYDARTGRRRGLWKYQGIFRDPNLSPDGTLWTLTRPDKQSFLGDVYDAQSGQKLWGPLVAKANGLPWTWSADGQKILFQTTARQSVAIGDARTLGHMGSVAPSANNQALALAPDGSHFYSLDDDGKIWRWRLR